MCIFWGGEGGWDAQIKYLTFILGQCGLKVNLSLLIVFCWSGFCIMTVSMETVISRVFGISWYITYYLLT